MALLSGHIRAPDRVLRYVSYDRSSKTCAELTVPLLLQTDAPGGIRTHHWTAFETAASAVGLRELIQNVSPHPTFILRRLLKLTMSKTRSLVIPLTVMNPTTELSWLVSLQMPTRLIVPCMMFQVAFYGSQLWVNHNDDRQILAAVSTSETFHFGSNSFFSHISTSWLFR